MIRFGGVLLCLLGLAWSCSNQGDPAVISRNQQGACDWCGAQDAPDNPPSSIQIAGQEEPGERMVITGQVLQPDGQTPAPNILVYAYHTNAQGRYPSDSSRLDKASRHGYLRGWMRTDAEGRFQFSSIRPAPYPSHAEPAHIHFTLTGPDFPEYWLSATWFAGDTLISEELLAKVERPGGPSNIISLTQDSAGTWRGHHVLVLDSLLSKKTLSY